MKKLHELTVWGIYILHFSSPKDEPDGESYARKYANIAKKKVDPNGFHIIFNNNLKSEVTEAGKKALKIYTPEWYISE